MYKTIVPDEPSFVLGLMVALRTLVSGIRRSGRGWRKALAQPFTEVTVAQMTQKHVPPVEGAFAQRAVLSVRLLGLVPLEDAVVVAVHDAHALVQVLQNHFVRHSVMPGQKLEIFAHECAMWALKRGRNGQVGFELVKKVLVGSMTQEMRSVQESGVANGTRHWDLVGFGFGFPFRCCSTETFLLLRLHQSLLLQLLLNLLLLLLLWNALLLLQQIRMLV